MKTTLITNHPVFPFCVFPEGTEIYADVRGNGDPTRCDVGTYLLEFNDYQDIDRIVIDDVPYHYETAVLEVIRTEGLIFGGDGDWSKITYITKSDLTTNTVTFSSNNGYKVHQLPLDCKLLELGDEHVTNQCLTYLNKPDSIKDVSRLFTDELMLEQRSFSVIFDKGLFRSAVGCYLSSKSIDQLYEVSTPDTIKKRLPNAGTFIGHDGDEFPKIVVNGEEVPVYLQCCIGSLRKEPETEIYDLNELKTFDGCSFKYRGVSFWLTERGLSVGTSGKTTTFDVPNDASLTQFTRRDLELILETTRHKAKSQNRSFTSIYTPDWGQVADAMNNALNGDWSKPTFFGRLRKKLFGK